MDSFCVSAQVLGTPKHLVVDESGFSWLNEQPADMWLFTGTIKNDHSRCLDTLFKLNKIAIEEKPEKRYRSPFEDTFGLTSVPWAKVMPEAAHRAFTKKLIHDIVEAIEKSEKDYYKGTWVPESIIFKHIRPANVDVNLLESYILSRSGNISALTSFVPTVGSMARAPKYDRLGTITGRLKISSGADVMTLKKEHRNILKSIHRNGKIMYVDFSALEPRIVLYEAGKRCDSHDVYSTIVDDLKLSSRKQAKAAVISEIYGGSKTLLGNVLGLEGKELNSFIRMMKSYFKTNDLRKKIKKQFIDTGHIKNRYGRIISVDEPLDHILFNYYVQSTGVDVSLLGFSSLIESINEKHPDVSVLFVLHDAMFIDVPEHAIDFVSSLKSVTVKGYVQSFPISVSSI